jgi:pyruvate,orthophosphate dikinase
MVYGNLNDDSGSGVCFTRNPATGEGGRLFGEFLPNAQGEDVVSGARTPLPVAEMAARFPAAHAELVRSTAALEREMRDMQDWCGALFFQVLALL